MMELNKYGRGFSTTTGKKEIIDYIKENIRIDSKILDVGFGCGIYARLLRRENYKYIDGLDIYGKGIKELKLDKYYNNIFISNILSFDFDYYDLIIMGDVLEHLTLINSKQLLEGWIQNNKTSNIIVSVPYEFKQGKSEYNPYEEHLQDQITKKYMKVNYPYLKLLFTNKMVDSPGKSIGVYVWKK